MQGRIVKALSGFYYVEVSQGVYTCRARGGFKNKEITPLVGDIAEIAITDEAEKEGVVEEILPRKNEFIRPPISNVDVFVVMFAISHPKPNFKAIDKLLVNIENAYADIVICVNKVDLDKAGEAEKIRSIYANIYKTCFISCKSGTGIAELRGIVKGKNVALAGPSGVGKSTLLNTLREQESTLTGKVSSKTGRGRHTTRHVEMFHTSPGGMVYDTPGFTSIDVTCDDEYGLDELFPEMRQYAGECRFDDCMHINEPGCAVKAELAAGTISESRYDSYAALVKEIRDNKKY